MALPAGAQEFFDTGSFDGPFMTLGARVGFNTSNMADTHNELKLHSLDSWGTGFTAGVVATLNINNLIGVQPGFFFESRSHNFAYVYKQPESSALYSEYGHTRNTRFKLPVMGIVRLHPADIVTWNIEVGPVFNFGLGGHSWYHDPAENPSLEHEVSYFGDDFNRFMLGLKMGTGFTVLDHYYIGMHYECGLRSARKYGMGGHDKTWTFTIGYDF